MTEEEKELMKASLDFQHLELLSKHVQERYGSVRNVKSSIACRCVCHQGRGCDGKA